jgi:hypothetical protein
VTLEPPKADASQGDLLVVPELGMRSASSRVEVLDAMATLKMILGGRNDTDAQGINENM